LLGIPLHSAPSNASPLAGHHLLLVVGDAVAAPLPTVPALAAVALLPKTLVVVAALAVVPLVVDDRVVVFAVVVVVVAFPVPRRGAPYRHVFYNVLRTTEHYPYAESVERSMSADGSLSRIDD